MGYRIQPMRGMAHCNDSVQGFEAFCVLVKTHRGMSEKIKTFYLFPSPLERNDSIMSKYPPSIPRNLSGLDMAQPDDGSRYHPTQTYPTIDQGAGPVPLVIRPRKHKVLVTVGGLS